MDLSEAAKDFITNLINEHTTELSRKLTASEEKVAALTQKLNDSNQEVNSLRQKVDKTIIELDDLQQYSRRQNVRIEGIEYEEDESETSLFGKIKKELATVGVTINKSEIVRFHRSSRPRKNNRDGKMYAQCIVKLNKWDARVKFKGLNKNAREANKSIRSHNDLTRRRYELLNKARSAIETKFGRDAGHYAFSDINSNLKMKLNGEFRAFNTLAELDSLLNDVGEEYESAEDNEAAE